MAHNHDSFPGLLRVLYANGAWSSSLLLSRANEGMESEGTVYRRLRRLRVGSSMICRQKGFRSLNNELCIEEGDERESINGRDSVVS